jgi:hypothetical protein
MGDKKPPGGQLGQKSSDLQEKILGPDYNYSKQIKAPSEMGMSSNGSFETLADDIGGLIAYVDVLVTGRGKASHTGKPLGTKFFLPTVMKCKDQATGKDVVRSIYVNNIPDGSIPFVSQGMGGATFTEFEGLLPGVLSNIAQINPMQILSAFTNGPSPKCQAITLETVDSNNQSSVATAYVSNTDIENMNPDWFSAPGQTSKPHIESFATMGSQSSLLEPKTLQGSKIDYSRMPNDFFIKIYLSSLGLLGLYIFLKTILRRRLK